MGTAGSGARTALLCAVALLLVAALAIASATAGGFFARDDAYDWPLTCGAGSFPVAALSGPTGVEKEDHPSAEAFRKFLKGPYIGYEFQDRGDYRLLFRNRHIAQYSSGYPDKEGMSVVEFGPKDGPGKKWWLLGLGGCRPTPVEERLNIAEWRLLKDGDSSIPPDTTRFTVLATERDCASGTNPRDRFAKPVISYGERRIVVLLRVHRLEGDIQTCQGNPSVKYRVHLSEPVGDRVVADGSSFPYRALLNSG